MPSFAAFCCGSDDRFKQALILFESFREIVTINIPFTNGVTIPQRCECDACDISTHDDFHWKWIYFLNNRSIWVWNGNEMIWDNILRLFKPPCGELIQDLSFVWNPC